MRHSVSREEFMKPRQHYTSAEPTLSRARRRVRIEVQSCRCNGWGEFETLWRILFQSQPDRVRR